MILHCRDYSNVQNRSTSWNRGLLWNDLAYFFYVFWDSLHHADKIRFFLVLGLVVFGILGPLILLLGLTVVLWVQVGRFGHNGLTRLRDPLLLLEGASYCSPILPDDGGYLGWSIGRNTLLGELIENLSLNFWRLDQAMIFAFPSLFINFVKLDKELLGMGANLRTIPGFNHLFHNLPIFTMLDDTWNRKKTNLSKIFHAHPWTNDPLTLPDSDLSPQIPFTCACCERKYIIHYYLIHLSVFIIP